MSETTEIRRHANGSIDIEYYARIGRGLHAQAVREAGLGLGAALRDMSVAIVAPPRRSPKLEDTALEFAPAT